MPLLRAVVRWSLANRPLVILATLLLTLLGVRAALRLPIDAVPDVTNVQVQVITTAPALSPAEVEQYVTVPVERAMAGIPAHRPGFHRNMHSCARMPARPAGLGGGPAAMGPRPAMWAMPRPARRTAPYL
jgi:hypothetical protein